MLRERNYIIESRGKVMDSKAFSDLVMKRAKLKGKHLRMSYMNRYSGTYDEIIGTFINIPKGEVGRGDGAREMNNRWMFIVSGFAKDEGQPPPSGKVKFKEHIRIYQGERTRGKTGTPEKIADYIIKRLNELSKIKEGGGK